MIDVRRLEPSQWLVLRELRLAALTDSPRAFGASYDHERDHDDQHWVATARRFAWFVAWVDEEPVGLAAGSGSFDCQVSERDLVSMWVVPAYRRQGVAAALVGAVCEWAAAQGAVAVTLWVIDGNGNAATAYQRFGFTEAYTSVLFREPSRAATKLALPLTPA